MLVPPLGLEPRTNEFLRPRRQPNALHHTPCTNRENPDKKRPFDASKRSNRHPKWSILGQPHGPGRGNDQRSVTTPRTK